MNKYKLVEKIAQNWCKKKSKKELENELIQLLILLPDSDIKDICQSI